MLALPAIALVVPLALDAVIALVVSAGYGAARGTRPWRGGGPGSLDTDG